MLIYLYYLGILAEEIDEVRGEEVYERTSIQREGCLSLNP